MKIKIEKKSGEKFLILFSDDERDVKGFFVNRSELRRLESNLNEILEYGNEQAGDDI